jgi:hypothetical protein
MVNFKHNRPIEASDRPKGVLVKADSNSPLNEYMPNTDGKRETGAKIMY